MIFNIVAQATNACQKGVDFFGLLPWYHYLDVDPVTCEIKSFNFLPNNGQPSDIPLVLLVVIDDLLRIAALVAVGFVIYGGVQLLASQGSPDEFSKARSTVINALAGLVLAMVAIAVVSFIGNSIG